MMRWRFAPLAILAATRFAAGQTLASVPPNTMPSKMCVACADRSVRIPVTAAKEFAPKEPPQVLSVVRAGLRLFELQPEFRAEWELAGRNGPPRAIVFKIGQKVRKAGVYDVLVALQPTTQPAADVLNVQIEHPAAKLQVPSKLTITRTWGFGWSEDNPKLQFIEQSGLSPIGTAGILWLTPAVHGNDPVTGRLELQAIATEKWELPAGRGLDVPYSLAGRFPLGTVTGALQITADELTEPVTLNYEVRTRLSTWLIPVYTLAGLLAGWLLKVFLKRRIQLEEARQKAGALRVRVLEDLSLYPDEPFRLAFEKQLRDLELAARDGDSTEIETRRQALETAWREALQTLTTRRQTAQSLIDDLRSLTGSSWSIPASIAAVVTGAGQEVEEAHRLLTYNDVAGSDAAARKLRTILGTEIRDAALAWQTAMGQVIDPLLQQRAISVAVKDGWQPEAEALRKTYLVLTANAQAATVADQEALLKGVSTAFSQVRNAFDRLRLRQSAELAQATERLVTVQAKLDPAAMATLKEAAANVLRILESAPENPRAAAEALASALPKLNEAWRRALLDRLPENAKPDVAAKLDALDYLGAANAVGRALAGVILKEGAKTEPPASAVVVSTLGQSSSTIVRYLGIASPWSAPQKTAASVFDSIPRLLIDKSVQSFVLFVLISIAAMSLFGATFTGDFADFAKIFFWAFGLDVTVDAMRDLLKAKPA